MTDRDQRLEDEVAALWREVVGKPPPEQADASLMLDALLKGMPEMAYDRLSSPYLRASTICGGPSRNF